ncbi:hypothetical protein O6H91_11G014500 [Diphasiastrum complanatum]|uniref:Uncharacterized protein n=2 Tax=Diphasiastrum complanatum TaxID=34168 RepID=A0ACC2C6H2_DIPCM|nr:hypothetical protein O6H91_11G013700 [Diphasiastrum complanatum]KAJ7537629.1 hypothetical protein O6H91_11G014500 [Diphasiastrum complanatum]
MSSWTIGAFTLVLLLLDVAPCFAEIKHVAIKQDDRPFIVFETFGFNTGGKVELNVSDVQVQNPKQGPAPDLSLMGFFLTTEDALLHVYTDPEQDPEQCILQNPAIKVLFLLREVQQAGAISKTYPVPEANEFTLFFENCQPEFAVTMNVRTSMYNLEGKNKVKNYLPAGQTQLPVIHFVFSLVYLVLGGVWVYICVRHKETVHRIHILMGVLVFLKTLNLLAEAEDKMFIERTGTAHGWDIVFYVFGLLRGVMLFTVIILIGTGWSILKPFLQDKEKKVLMVVIPLQVLANIASAITDEKGPAIKAWFIWIQLFLLLDIICCCAVLFPIVWSIKHLREASHTDGKAARNLVRLTLFRQYYIVVVSYIYFTRILVFTLNTVTAYQYRWFSYLSVELATLAFYTFTGFKFQPAVHNPYFVLDDEEDVGTAHDDLNDDDFDL